MFNLYYLNLIHIFCSFIYNIFIKYNFCKYLNTFFAYHIKYVFNCGSWKCQILKNGSDYHGVWPPLIYVVHKSPSTPDTVISSTKRKVEEEEKNMKFYIEPYLINSNNRKEKESFLGGDLKCGLQGLYRLNLR